MSGPRARAPRRPIILVSGPDRGGLAAWLFLALAVLLAGGCPRRATPSRPRPDVPFQGLILSGGADVDPGLYGEERDMFLDEIKASANAAPWAERWLLFPLIHLVRRLFSARLPGRPRGSAKFGGSDSLDPDKARDDLECGLIDRALAGELPILGVCRGAQLLNVRFGGGLYQDVRPFYVETPHLRTVLPKKTVRLTSGSLLAAIVGEKPLRVNALHHQAVRDLGQGVRAVAREANGVVQAVERADLPFVVGVQWHPEFLPQKRRQRRLFQALVEAARRVDPAAGNQAARGAQTQGSCP